MHGPDLERHVPELPHDLWPGELGGHVQSVVAFVVLDVQRLPGVGLDDVVYQLLHRVRLDGSEQTRAGN